MSPMFLDYNEEENMSLSKYEAMLKSNRVLFFDSNEFENIIQHYLDNGELNRSKKALKIALQQHPNNISLQLLNVEVLIFEGKKKQAEALLDEIEHISPENEEVYIQRASLKSKEGLHQEAVSLLFEALKRTEDLADVHSLLGMEYLIMDDYDNSRKHYEACLKHDPQDYTALYNTMNCYLFMEDTNGAILFLNNYLEVNPYCEVAWHQLGIQFVELKSYNKALAAYNFAIYSDDTFVGAYIEKGKVLEHLGKYEEAIENYTLTLRLEDPLSFALLHIGRCYEKLNNTKEALKYYEKTVNEDPLLDKGWKAITDYYFRNKDYQKALYHINKALDIDPENGRYWIRYAKINSRLSYFEEAEKGYRKGIEFGENQLNNWLERIDLLLKLDEESIVTISLDQALKKFPDNPELMYRKVGLLLQEGNLKKGMHLLKEVAFKHKEYSIILEELFPNIFNMNEVQDLVA